MSRFNMLVSLVVPLHDEGPAAAEFVRGAHAVLATEFENYELLLVDDASRDGSVDLLVPLLRELPCVRLLRFSRRFGRDAAISAGVETAIGDVVVVMQVHCDRADALPELVRTASKHGIVCGVDPGRTGESWLERYGAAIFYWLCKHLFDVEVVQHATGLLALNRQALNALLRVKERNRYLQLFLPLVGFNLQTWAYRPASRPRRRALGDSIERAVGMVVAGSLRPLRLVSGLSLLASLSNGLYMLYVAAVALLKEHVSEGWPTLSMHQSVMFFFLFLVLAVLAEYVGRLLEQGRQRPAYVVREEQDSSVLLVNEERRNVVSESR